MGEFVLGVDNILVHLKERGLLSSLMHVTSDSRCVRPGSVFFSFPSSFRDKYLKESIERGAVCIVSDETCYSLDPFFIVVLDLYDSFCELHSFLIHQVDKLIERTAVVGTNGKTTTVHFIREMTRQFSIPLGTMGTLGLQTYDFCLDVGLTTPSIEDQYGFLKKLYQNSISQCVFEFSSHAIHQRRVVRGPLKCALFTSFSQDHLDYHLCLSNYFEVKRSVFSDLKAGSMAILNGDDSSCRAIQEVIPQGVKVVRYGFSSEVDVPLVRCSQGIKIGCDFIFKALIDWSDFNISNFAMALLWCHYVAGVSWRDIQGMNVPSLPPGRLEKVESTCASVYIDYAHSPDSVERVLSFLYQRYGKLVVVFGCGGDRDKYKRPLMAKSVEPFAHRVIVTEDNSRFESIESIFSDIRRGFSSVDNVFFIQDRVRAIEKAVLEYSQKFCVVILGKGHEKFQEIAQQKNPFCDRIVAEKILNRLS